MIALNKQLKTTVAQRGLLRGLDGRPLPVRSDHMALNTLLQSAGAVIMKQAIMFHYQRTRKLNAQQVLTIHDENQMEVIASNAETVGKIMRQAIIDAGTHFKLNIPLDGEYKIGDDWSATH